MLSKDQIAHAAQRRFKELLFWYTSDLCVYRDYKGNNLPNVVDRRRALKNFLLALDYSEKEANAELAGLELRYDLTLDEVKMLSET